MYIYAHASIYAHEFMHIISYLQWGNTALTAASVNAHVKCIDTLLTNGGAKIDQRDNVSTVYYTYAYASYSCNNVFAFTSTPKRILLCLLSCSVSPSSRVTEANSTFTLDSHLFVLCSFFFGSMGTLLCCWPPT